MSASRRALGLVLDQVAKGGVALLAHRLVERGGAVGHRLHVDHLSDGDVHRLGDLVVVRFAPELRREAMRRATHLADAVDHVYGQADGLPVGSEGPLDGLLDPPGGVGAELAALVRVEPLDRLDQTKVALADQVHQREAEVIVVLGDTHDEAQVRLNHVLPGGLIALEHAAGEGGLLLERQQRRLTDLVEVGPQRGALVAGKLFPRQPGFGRVKVGSGRRDRSRNGCGSRDGEFLERRRSRRLLRLLRRLGHRRRLRLGVLLGLGLGHELRSAGRRPGRARAARPWIC